jgi:site-specific recombinase XerD
MAERQATPTDPLFATTRGRPLSRYGIDAIIDRHVHTATKSCPTLASKTISAHTLRHTAAMRLLHAGVDTTVIALWLGHESVDTTQIYVHADLTLKERALSRTTPIGSRPGRYRPPDTLLAFLEAL